MKLTKLTGCIKMLKVFNKKNALFFKLFSFIMLLFFVSQLIDVAFAKEQLRDPFVSLVDKEGNIVRGHDLFLPTKEILPNIILKGILWDEQNPLAVINDKILPEGSQIVVNDGNTIRVVVLEKINEENVVLSYNDREFIIKLRRR